MVAIEMSINRQFVKQKYILNSKSIFEILDNIVKVIVSSVCAFPDSSFELTLNEHKPTRTSDQNDKMWAMLNDISSQVEWVVDGVKAKLSSEEWKDIFTASFKKEMRVASGLSGGIVILGKSTKRMKVKDMADLIELMYVFGAERNVIWSDE